MVSTPISTGETGALRARLEENGEKWLGCIRDVTGEQAQFSPGEGRWNILQVAEHVAVAERQMGFYRRVFDMEILSGALPVRGFALPRVLMGLRFRERAALLYRRLPFLAPSGEDLRRYACGAELPLDRDEGGSIAARRRSAAGDARA